MFKNLFRRKWLEMSFGELADKIAILEVKMFRLDKYDPRQCDLKEQYDYILDGMGDYVDCYLNGEQRTELARLMYALYKNANTQWDFEDAMSKIGDDVPIPERLEAMKGSYFYNRKRALLKKEVDELFNEKWKEVKQYSGMSENKGEYKL